MNYWAKDDSLFADGHYVEDWELQRFGELSADVQAFVRSEASCGNKLQSLLERTVVLSHAPSCGVLGLPEGLSFLCPPQHEGVRVYDGDEDVVILSLERNERIYPSGFESPNPFAPEGWESGRNAV